MHQRLVRGGFKWVAACCLVVLSGCATGGGARSDGSKAAVQQQVPAKDRVLWNYRQGLTALRQGRNDEAKRQLDEALSIIGNVFGPDNSAKKSRGYFTEESKKNFIGEPYERVMAYFYRGVLYWMDGEPDNARACFRSGELMDSDAEQQGFRSDYATLDYLDGYATFKLNGDGSDALARAQTFSKLGQLPPYNKKANTLIFFEFGDGPKKYASGEYNEKLHIKESRSIVQGAWFKEGNRAVRIGPYDDLNFQATTRGGRVMDHVLANKSVFKSTTDVIGDVGIIGGAIAATQRKTRDAGLVGIGIGVISKIASAATTPAADTRTWDNLPQYISFAALESSIGNHTGTVEFTNGAGQVIPNLTKTVQFTVVADRDTVIFVSDH